MGDRRGSWRQTFRAFGEAAVGVLRAEVAVVRETWSRSFQELGRAAIIAAGAAYLGLILVPSLLVFALLTGLRAALGWPLWGAALAVAAVVAAAAYGLFKLAGRLLSRGVESPVATVRHRITDHVDWWNERVLSDGESEGEADEAALESGGPAPGGPAPGA